MKDFFISYNKADRAHALAIQCWLEDGGHSTVMQATDFQAGSNFVLEMDAASKTAKRTLAVLSPDYLLSAFTAPEWAAAFVGDPTGQNRKLVPIRVRECEPGGLLKAIVYIDLVGLDMASAQKKLLAELDGERVAVDVQKPTKKKRAGKKADKKPVAGIHQQAKGSHIYQSAGDMVVHQKPVVNKTEFVREPHHVSESQAATIKQKLDDLGERDEKAGKGSTYGKWMNMFKRRFGLTTYKALPELDFEDALSWIRQQRAINRSALRRTNNTEWRKDHYGAIWASANELEWGSEQVHQAAQNYFNLKKPVSSLKDLGEQKLEKFAGYMKRESRKRKRF